MKEVRASIHKAVLLNEIIEGLHLADKSVVLDGTFGGGGHSFEICNRHKGVKIIAIDQDQNAWESAKGKFEGLNCDVSFTNENFRHLDKVLAKMGIQKVDGIILDFGLSSDQLEYSGRGFSFRHDEPLLMTMKENPSPEDITAQDVVNTWGKESLADIIYGYGEEKQARRIAGAIVEARQKKKIETTFELVKIIESAVPAKFRKGKIHFATKTFQALRMAVNDELGAIGEGLERGLGALRDGGRMAVISFHSLEDRVVKKFYKEKQKLGEVILINKKPIIAGANELTNNPRARSAKLRILEKIKK